MTLLAAGVALWWLAHLFRRIAPGPRAALGEQAGKGVVALLLVAAIVLMIFGYRAAEPDVLYAAPSWAWHLNNVLMFAAVALFGAGQSKGRARSWIRHPMLSGFALWALAHLLVNGDVPSLVLFGGLGVWAIVEILVLNRAQGPWLRPEPGPASGDLRLLVIALVLYTAIAAVHWWLGVSPFPG